MNASFTAASPNTSPLPPTGGRAKGLLAAAAVVLGVHLAACHDEPQQVPTTESTTAASNAADPHSGMGRKPAAPPPLVQKTNLAQLCAYDTLTFRNARTAYTKSLGAAEPGPDKIPDFGQSPPSPPKTAEPAPSSSAGPAAGSAAPKAPPAPKPSASATASAAPAAGSGAPAASASAGPAPVPSGKVVADRRLTGIRYQQYTKSCQLLVNTKEPPAPELDAAMAEWAPFATELAKNLTEASMYYQQSAYKEDNFAKGKELHKKLVEAFGQLDALQTKLLAALKDFETKSPIDRSAWTEGQKLSNAFNTAAIAFLLDVNGPKVDWKAAKDDLDKIDKALADFTAFRKDNGNDPFVQRGIASAEQFAQQAHAIYDDSKDKEHVVPAQGVALTNFVDRLLVNDNQATIQSLGGGPSSFSDKLRPRVQGRPTGPVRARPASPAKKE